MKISGTCLFCGIKFGSFFPSQVRKYCCKEHKALHYSEIFTGENNPNFGNRWSDELRTEASEIVKKRMEDPEARFIAGSANRGKKFDEDRIRRMYENRTPDWAKKWRPSEGMSDSTKALVGKASAERHKCPEYKARLRKAREETGEWMPVDQKSDMQIYYIQSNWIAKMWNLVEDTTGVLKEHGVLNTRKNSIGAVRDHMYSRRTGFENGVFPEILRHPCNCAIISNIENVKKRQRRYVDGNSQTLEILFNLIENYFGVWIEQAEVLRLISNYRSGLRWQRTASVSHEDEKVQIPHQPN